MHRFNRELDTLRAWVGELDAEVADNRAERRAQTQTLNALRTTQIEQQRTLERIAGQVGRLTIGQTELADRFTGLDTKVDGLEAKVDGLDTKVDGLDHRFDGLVAVVHEVLRRLPEPGPAAEVS